MSILGIVGILFVVAGVAGGWAATVGRGWAGRHVVLVWPLVVLAGIVGAALIHVGFVADLTPEEPLLAYQDLNLFRAPYTLYVGNAGERDIPSIGYAIRDAATGAVLAGGTLEGLGMGSVRYLPVAFDGGRTPPAAVELCLAHDGLLPFQGLATVYPLARPEGEGDYYLPAGRPRALGVFFRQPGCGEAFVWAR